jgi:hypothetical protein
MTNQNAKLQKAYVFSRTLFLHFGWEGGESHA